MRLGERPAVVREIVAVLEIDGIQWQAIATPMVSRAAKIAQPAYCQILEGPAYALPLVQLLSFLAVLHAAAFEEHHAKRRVDELAGERNTGCARPNDANLGFQDRSGRNRARIDDHKR